MAIVKQTARKMRDKHGNIQEFVRKVRRNCPDYLNPHLLRVKFNNYIEMLNRVPVEQTGKIQLIWEQACRDGTDALMKEKIPYETLKGYLKELEIAKDDDYSKWTHIESHERQNHIEVTILQYDIYLNACLRKKRNFQSNKRRKARLSLHQQE